METCVDVFKGALQLLCAILFASASPPDGGTHYNRMDIHTIKFKASDMFLKQVSRL